MAFLIVTMSLYEEILVKPSIPRFSTIFPKYLLKISSNSLSSETIIVFNGGNSFNFQSFICKQRFYGFPKGFIFGNVFYIEIIEKLLFGLS